MNITGLHSFNARTGSHTDGLKVDQKILGQVKQDTAGKMLISAAGQNFSLPVGMKVSPGMEIVLKVISLHPQLNLKVLNTSSQKERKTKELPGSIVSSKLFQSLVGSERNNLAGILHAYQALSLSNLKSLPGSTLALLSTLKSKLLKQSDLANPEKLKSAIKNSGVFLESKLVSNSSHIANFPADDLKAILFQLLKSMESLKNSPNLRSYVQNSQHDTEEAELNRIRAVLKSRADASIEKITSNQIHTINEFNKGNQRWFFELPLISAEQNLSIPMTIYRKASEDEDNQSNKPAPSPTEEQWCAEFSLNLSCSGSINVYLNINDMSASVSICSESRNMRQALNDQHDNLRTNLNSGGLILDKFNILSLSVS